MRIFISIFATVFFTVFAQAGDQPDYFARFKYSEQEAVRLIQNAHGKTWSEAPVVRQLMDDLGFWKMVRQDSMIRVTPELKDKLRAQYRYLEKAFKYEVGDLVWVFAANESEKAYGVGRVNHRAQIIEHQVVDGADLFLVDVYVDGAQQMQERIGTLYTGNKGKITYYKPDYQLTKIRRIYTKTELDALNSPSTTLPVDNVGEKYDWTNDQVWLEKLEKFKSQMANNGFEIDFRAEPKEIEQKQQELMLQIFRFFKMNRNAPSNNGRGIGLRSCGGGVCFDQALVLTSAIQAVGQTLGIKAYNLNGTTVNPMGGHGFVRYDLKTVTRYNTFDKVFPYEAWEELHAKKKHDPKLSGGVLVIDYKLPSSLATYPGVKVKTSTWTGISDPGWADYGITPDFFARMPVGEALNPLPVDSNRAVHGMSSSRSLTEVAQNLNAQGPLNTYIPQLTLDSDLRLKLNREIESGKKLFEAVLLLKNADGRSCSQVFN